MPPHSIPSNCSPQNNHNDCLKLNRLISLLYLDLSNLFSLYLRLKFKLSLWPIKSYTIKMLSYILNSFCNVLFPSHLLSEPRASIQDLRQCVRVSIPLLALFSLLMSTCPTSVPLMVFILLHCRDHPALITTLTQSVSNYLPPL